MTYQMPFFFFVGVLLLCFPEETLCVLAPYFALVVVRLFR